MADDDLYGDLNTSADTLRAKSLEQELAATKEKCERIEKQLAILQRKEKSLTLENEQLARNISCLFNTANAEIARKDKWIDQLRRQLQEMEKERSGDSRR